MICHTLNAFLPGKSLLQPTMTRGAAIESDGPDLTDEPSGALLSIVAPIAQSERRYQNTEISPIRIIRIIRAKPLRSGLDMRRHDQMACDRANCAM
jgi:hypothetical protein